MPSITYLFTNPPSANEIANPFILQASQSPPNHLVSVVHRHCLQSQRKEVEMWFAEGSLMRLKLVAEKWGNEFLTHLLVAIKAHLVKETRRRERNVSLTLVAETGKRNGGKPKWVNI